MSKQSTASGGFGFGSILTLIFITLKLCGVITWSWVWVLCPIWIPLGIVLVFLVFYFVIIAAFMYFLNNLMKK